MRNKIRNLLYGAITLMACISCTHSQDKALEKALQLAGKNRTELESVLTHYQNSPLKLEAAKFLIRNMPGHYSFTDTTEIKPYYDAVDSVLTAMQDSNIWIIRDSLVSIGKRYAYLSPKKTEDVQIITARFLIQNIDSAFAQWQMGPWARHLDFEQFCEYLLPYKTEETQPLDAWRTYLRLFHPDHLNELHYCDQFKNSASRVAITLNNNLWYYMHPAITDESVVRPTPHKSTSP